MVLYRESGSIETKDEFLGKLNPGETVDQYIKKYSNIYAQDPNTEEIQQEFEIASDGMHLTIVPQPKPEATQMLLKNFTEYFKEKYFEKTGLEWRNSTPRKKIVAFMWKPFFPGKTQLIRSTAIVQNPTLPRKHKEYQIKTLSASPKVFKIDDFLGYDEIIFILNNYCGDLDNIVTFDNAKFPFNVNLIGSKTRWIENRKSLLIENICYRACDILKLPRKYTINQACENVQIMLFDSNSKEREIYDFLLPEINQTNLSIMQGNNRYATFLICLEPSRKGGDILFPLSRTGSDGLSVKLTKGSAIMFYNMLKDGNLDENSFYRVLGVGEKDEQILAAIRVWDKALY